MKKILMLFIIFTSVMYSQVDFRTSLGINFINTPELRDYINQLYRQYGTGEELSTFSTAVNFSAESDYYFDPSFAAGIELAYILNSFTIAGDIGQRELQYSFLMPSLTVYYMLSGSGYNFKFGGGVGPRFSFIQESVLTTTTNHTASGFGVLLKADGNTLLSGNLYANIGIEMRYDLNGSFQTKIPSEVDLDAFSVGIHLGATYIFQ